MSSDNALRTSANIAIKDCMAVKEGETLLIVTDDKLENIGRELYEAGKAMGIETMMTVIKPRASHAGNAPDPVAAAMAASDAVIAATSTSFTHTKARREACAAGARVATMPGITVETLKRGLSADYEGIAVRTERLTEMLTNTETVRITSEKGTDITIPIDGIEAIASTGLIREKGSFGNLPSGEAYLMPKENHSKGIFIVDGSFAGVGKVPEGETITCTVEDGFVTKIEGGSAATKLEELLEPFGKEGRNLAELGIGTNDAAQICGMILEDEKVQGTVHLAVGNNKSMGGTVGVQIHLDGVIMAPDVWFDDKKIMERGEFLISF
jgi:leucyl aminopeptidase (aminopeptidase T)